MNKKLSILAIVLLSLVTTASFAAALQSRAGGAFLYDPVADVTWTNDWNLAWSTRHSETVSSSGDVLPNGQMTWQAANDWAAGLTLAGGDDWRLPSVSIDSGCYNQFPRIDDAIARCTSGEFSSLWTNTFGGDRGDRPGNMPNQDAIKLFDNIQASAYWTASLNQQDPSGNSINAFSTFGGYIQDGLNTRRYAVAVHDGDIAAALPDPALPAPILETRHNGLFLYDPINDLTWLADANHAWNNDYDDEVNDFNRVRSNGEMTYDAAREWAAQLVVDGIDGWRLPEVPVFDSACFNNPTIDSRLENCTQGDFTDLWVSVLGLDRGDRLMETDQLIDTRLFDHWQTASYWTGSLNLSDTGGNSGHRFSTSGGYLQDSLDSFGHVIAVRDGDVGDFTGRVPLPAPIWLFGVAIIGLSAFGKRSAGA